MVLEEKTKKEFKETFKKKKALFEEILKISELQKRWIQKDDWKRLMNAINTKQDKIEKVNRLNHALEQFASEHNNYQSEELNHLIKETNEIIYIIQSKEKENINMINEIMKNDKAELKNMKLKKTVNTAYSNIKGIQNDGCFIDKFK